MESLFLDNGTLAVERHGTGGIRGQLVVVHGMFEHMGRHRGLVDALGAQGFACVLFDLRGHGKSPSRHGAARFRDHLDDVERVCALVEADEPPPGTPRFLLGHSLGGLIALQYVATRQDHGFDGLILSSPFLGLAGGFHPGQLLLRVLGRLLPDIPVKNPVAGRNLSHDPAVAAGYADDPLVRHTIGTAFLGDVIKAQDFVMDHVSQVAVPTIMLLGSADPVADMHVSRRAFEALGSVDKALEIYEGFLHEVFHEVGKERVVRDLLAWLDHRALGTVTDRVSG